MAIDVKVRVRLERALGATTPELGPRAADDARRLWGRVGRFLAMGLIPRPADAAPLELACYALQLPNRPGAAAAGSGKPAPANRMGQASLRDRSEQAAELLVNVLNGEAPEDLVARATALLREIPLRRPAADEAKLLADAVNLDDFGMTGLFLQAIQQARTGGGLSHVVEGWEKRTQYGYWDVRLKDSFHFDAVRRLARERLESAAAGAAMLLRELTEDRPDNGSGGGAP